MPADFPTASRDQPKDVSAVPLRAKIGYGTGGIGVALMSQSVQTVAHPIFNVVLGVNAGLVGLALSLPRLWDAITDPIMGVISDRHAWRGEHRRPYMALGAVLSGLLFALIWWAPAGRSDLFYFSWLLGFSLCYFTATTVFSVPYYALGAEMSSDYDERTRIAAWRMFISSGGRLFMPWLVPFCYLEIFDGPVEGVRWLGLLLGAVIALTGLLPVWFCREPAQRRRDNGLPRVRPVEMIRQAARNRPFLMLLGCSLTKMAGTSFVSSLGIYVLTYYAAHGDWKQGAILQGYVSTVYFVAAAASAPLMSALAVRFGKRGAFFVGIAAAFAGSALKWWLYAPDVGWIIVIVPLLLAPGVAGVDMLLHSMMADVCDYEQWKNGERRVGLLSAAQTWLTKTALSLSFAVAGLILNAVGFDEARALQDESTLFWLRLLFSWIPAVLMVMSALFLWRYPLSEARLKEIQAELAARETGSNANGSSHP